MVDVVSIVVISLCFNAYVSAVKDSLDLTNLKYENISELTDNHENLKQELSIMKDSLNEILKMYKRLEMENMVIKNNYAEMKEEHTQMKMEISRIKEQQHEMMETLKDGFAMDKRLILPSGNSVPSEQHVIAFTAILTHVVTISSYQAIAFDTVLTNIGNAYDTRNGQFIVPITGVYILSATIYSEFTRDVHVQMVRDGQMLAALFCVEHDMTSRTIIVSLNKGDKVWMRKFYKGTTEMFGSRPDSNYCNISFSGALITTLT